jgi:(2Fe-2S) ferredoxin
MKYDKHIFVCTNQKAEGKKCCGEAFGMELVNRLRARIKEENLSINIRAQRAGCLDVCAFGPAMVIYPEGVFYGALTLEHVDQIFEEHIKGGKIVSELELTF